MLIGLNGSTTNQCTLIEDIKVTKASNFDVLELRTYKIEDYLKNGGTLSELNKIFQDNNIKPYAINALEFFTLKKTKEEEEKMLSEAEYWCKIASSINCPYIVAVPSRFEDESPKEIKKDAIEMLTKLSDIGEKYNVKFAFEFIGFSDFSVRTLESAYDIVKEVNRENIGVLVDTYHFFIGQSTMESIEKIDTEKVFIFHVNDAEKGVNLLDLTEDHRVFPGIGSFPLKEIGQAFKKKGYNEIISLELFRKDYWEMDMYDLGKEAYKHMKKAEELMFN